MAPEKVDILLVNPPSGLFYGLGPNFAPIGLFCLAAYLRPRGFSVAILNANYFPDYQSVGPLGGPEARRPDRYYYADDRHNHVWRQALYFIGLVAPRLLGFSCHDLAVGGVKFLAQMVKRLWPLTVTAVGGPTPTGAPDIFSDCKDLDFIITGEGEESLLQLAEKLRLEDWQPPKAWQPIILPSVDALIKPIKDLDALPDPIRDYYWIDYVNREIVKDSQLNGVYTSRGCQKACRFCAAKKLWPGGTRYRSISRVVEEVKNLRSQYGYDFQHFSIFDDDFLARPDRVKEFCRLLNETGDSYLFRCYGRVGNLQSEKVIEMVLQAGCQEIWVGVESGSSKILKDLNKGITVSQIKRLDRLFANYDFPWLAFVILGTPTEEEDDLEKTFEMLRQGLFPAIEPFTFHPYTGTELFDELLSLGLINYDQVVRGHQSLGLHFSPKVPRKIFFARLAQIKELARQRKARWQREFYLTEAENQKALAWETNCQNWLKISSKSWLVLGPERRLRWLAALNHYRNLKADLVFIDLDSNTKNQCLFGTINPASFLEKQQERDILLVSSLEEIETWEAKIKALNLKPISLLASAETLGDSGKAFWRPVYQMSRLIKGE